MNNHIYCVRDRLAQTAGAPFLQVNDECAMRYFQAQQARAPEYAADMELWHCGVFNILTGAIEPDLRLVQIGGVTVEEE